MGCGNEEKGGEVTRAKRKKEKERLGRRERDSGSRPKIWLMPACRNCMSFIKCYYIRYPEIITSIFHPKYLTDMTACYKKRKNPNQF